MIGRHALGMAAVALAATVLAGTARSAQRACVVNDMGKAADAVLASFGAVQPFSGAMLVARDGGVVLRRAVGLADREWDIPNTPDAKFRIGSLTKQFTAAAILQLAEQGRLSIDDPISRYYADAPASWSKVTLRTLLDQRSGIPDYSATPGSFEQSRIPRTPAQLIALVRDQPLQFEPGSSFAYSNTGYVLLGYVIEKVSGQSYAEYLKAHVFGPLGLKDTGYDLPTEILPRRASGYGRQAGGWRNAAYIDTSSAYAAGALYSTVDDLLKWEEALFGGRVVSPGSLKLMTTDWGGGYGFGLVVGKRGGHEVISHDGGINGFSSSMQHLPGKGVTSIVLANVYGAPADLIATDLALTCLGESATPEALALPAAVLDRYAGVYAAPRGPRFRITREGDHLLANDSDGPPLPLYPRDQRTFFAKLWPGEMSFELDAHGRPAALIVRPRGGTPLRLPRAD